MSELLFNTSTFALAYLGDAWYELWCRNYVLSVIQKPSKVHKCVVGLVRCQTQSKLMREILPFLNDEERLIYRRGKNLKPLGCPKHATVEDYRIATGFECLIGAWYLQENTQRFEKLLEQESIRHWFAEKLLTTTDKERN
ncbi:ribonuclease III domain-containing protein [Deltaproteobacteria bacterium TL4]